MTQNTSTTSSSKYVGFSAAERAAMKERIKEEKAAARRAS